MSEVKTEEEVREAYEYSNFRLDDENKFAGGGIVESFAELVGAIKKDGENDAAQIAVASVTVGLDVLGMVLDPLGTVFAAGVGWLIEHIGFLREPLDLLMGDPDAIKANAALLQMEAVKFKQYAAEHDEALAKVASWTGEAAEKFRKSMRDLSEEIQSYGEIVSGASDTTVNMGVGVAATRAVVRDIIATLIGGLVAGALVALAAAFFTFGASIAGFIATAIGLAASTAAKIAKMISNVTGMISRNSKRLADLTKYMDDVSTRLDRFAAAARRNPWRPGGSWTNPSDDLANLPPFNTSPNSSRAVPPPKRSDTAPPDLASPPPKTPEPTPTPAPTPPPRSNTMPGNGTPPPPPPPHRQDTAPASTTPPGPTPKPDDPKPQRSDTMPNMPPPKGVPESSWAAWTKGGYRNHEQLMRPINELNRLPQQAIADIARRLFGNKHANEVLDALETAKNVREPSYMITVGGVQIPLGAFGASFSQMANEATKADDGRESAREAAGA
ncbi:WXG100 family type VII secretion target [Kibdelosporangium persicum]|uniref:ESX-1 secretion-associated protein EspA/EspE-like domain-containing protein n=1 Tax=Kibdelosporangium persicum TaxID=2698649 RepID=A0ABX2F5H6_9PSEU|nr:hypothetical protein [Kibdelosporangium persicum]NRN66152.1 hypothetical protein [Kibdelosporangium persicum]